MARLIGNVDATGSLTTPNATIDTSYTKLWLDGSDLTDKSGTNTLTVTGVTSSTAHSKFGGSSLFLTVQTTKSFSAIQTARYS